MRRQKDASAARVCRWGDVSGWEGVSTRNSALKGIVLAICARQAAMVYCPTPRSTWSGGEPLTLGKPCNGKVSGEFCQRA